MIEGIDVSHWQGSINWGAVPDKYKWAAIKCSEGSSFKDSKFIQNYDGARASGKRVGAYHFFRANVNTGLQEANFFEALGGRVPDFAVLDVESQDGASVVNLRNRVYWSLRFMEKLDVPVVIYTANWFWSSPIGDRVMPKDPPSGLGLEDPQIRASGWRLWVADYGANDGTLPPNPAVLPRGWRDDSAVSGEGPHFLGQTIRQYTSRGSVPGIAGNVDLNTMGDDFFDVIDGEEPPIPPPSSDHEERIEELELQVANIKEWGESFPV